MATLDNINLFAVGGATDDTQDPLYPEYLALVEQFEAMKDMPTIPGGYPDAPSFSQFKRQKEAEVARDILAENLESGDIKKAYEEGFTQLPIVEQAGTYMFPPTGVPLETYETGYFADEAGFQMKKPGEALLDLVNPLSSPLERLPFTAEDPMSAMLAPLSAAGALGGLGELANIPKAGLMALRRYQQKSMDGGGGGIGGLPKPQQETTKDLAGYKSNVYEEAKAVADELSPKALLQYLKSNKRTNPQNNKLGVGLKQTELDEIDLDAFEAEMNRVYPDGNFEKQELLDYINDNRVQLYRIKRTENPTVRIADLDDERNVQEIDFEFDEPMTMELRRDKAQIYYENYEYNLNNQINFADTMFGPTGFITKDNFNLSDKDFVDKFNDTYDSTDYENPFSEENVSMFDAFDADGTFYESIPPSKKSSDAVKRYLDAGFTVRPKVMDESFDTDRLSENAAEARVEFDVNDNRADEYYSYEGQDGNQYTLIGNDADGYNVGINGSYDDTLGEYIPFDEARIQVSGRINENLRDEGVVVDSGVDNAYNDADFKYTVSDDVVTGDATLPVKYGEEYGSYRLPMGGATDYEEYTVHIDNPKTKTRYSRDYGEKHFGGGDELFHIRTSVRTDENGKKVLFVEEIQSDLHSTARSTKSDATYELPRKEQQKIMQQLEDMGIKQDPTRTRATKGGIFKNTEGEDTFVDYGSLPYIAKAITQGRTENFGSKNADDFVKTFGFEKTKEIGKIAEKLYQGELPDFPYKKDWVDLAVKEALKIGAEKNVDRIAFTNAPTQVKRNNKSVYYNQDIIVNKLPTREELPDTPEFAERYQANLKTRYDDQFPYDVVVDQKPTQEEYYASIPSAKKQANNLSQDVAQKLDNLRERVLDDADRFKQQYPEAAGLIDAYELYDLEGGPSRVEDAYFKLRQMEMDVLAARADANLDITADPRNVDVTNPALARLLDADLSFREFPEDVMQELNVIDSMIKQIDDIDTMYPIDKEGIKALTVDELAREFRLDDYKYKLEKVGYPLEGDELLNPQKIQLEGDDYDTQRYGTRMLDGEEALAVELGEELGPKTIEKLQSGKSQVVIPKDELEGSGMKFLEIYKNEIPRGINKVLKDLKVKEVKPSISNVLFAREDIDPNKIRQEYIKQKNASIDEFGTTDTVFDAQVETHSSIGIDLTDDMKRKILQEGLNNMYMGGKVSKSNSMDKPIAGNVREM